MGLSAGYRDRRCGAGGVRAQCRPEGIHGGAAGEHPAVFDTGLAPPRTVIDDARQSGCSIFSYRPTSSYRAKAQRESQEDYLRLASFVRNVWRRDDDGQGQRGTGSAQSLIQPAVYGSEAAPVEERAAEEPTRKRGRPRKTVQRKTISFFLIPELAERLDDAYYDWNAGLSKEMRVSRAEFREMVLEKGLDQLAKSR